MKPFPRALLFALLLSAITIVGAYLLQTYATDGLPPCSYLDPPIIDYLAFSAAVFLVIEGAYRLRQHATDLLSSQWTRAFRIAFGCAILTLHAMQFAYK